MDRSRIATLDVDGHPSLGTVTRRFRPGVTILGDDVEDRTALLRCLRACLGIEAALDDGLVGATLRLTVDGSTYTRSIERRDGAVVAEGEPFPADATLSEEYACLVGSTVTGSSVDDADELGDLLFGPTAVAETEAELDRLREEIAETNQRLATMASAEADLPTLTERRASVAEHRETLAERLADTEADRRRRRDAERDAKAPSSAGDLAAVRRARERFREVRRDVHETLETIESLCEERRSIREDRQELGESPDASRPLETRLADRRRERDRLQRTIRQLGSVIELADGLLAEDGTSRVVEALADADRDGLAADADAESPLVCWTCGSAVGPEQVRETKDTLEAIRSEKVAELNDLDAEIEDLERTRERHSDDREHRRSLDERQEAVEAELAEKREDLEALRERRSELVEEIDAFEQASRSRDDGDESEILTLERTANRQALELHRADTDWETLTERIHDVLDRLGTRAELEAERARKTDRRSDLEFERDRIQATVIDRFDAELDALLATTDGLPIESLRIDRRGDDADRADEIDRSVPALFVRPAGADEAIAVERAGDRTRRIAGLLMRLAGYVVHDVHESVPFLLLLDLPESLAAGVTDDTLAHLTGYSDYLVVSSDSPLTAVSVEGTEPIEGN